jgi:hypothetical protein
MDEWSGKREGLGRVNRLAMRDFPELQGHGIRVSHRKGKMGKVIY